MKKLIFAIFIYNAIAFSAQAQKQPVDTARYITINVDIPQLQRKRDLQIFLPADYRTSNKKYPVLYMHDAQNLYNKGVSRWQSWGVDIVV